METIRIYNLYEKGIMYIRKKFFRFYSYIKLGKGSRAHGFFKIQNKKNVHIGQNCAINEGVIIQGNSCIIIGDNVVISTRSIILDGGLILDEKGITNNHFKTTTIIENNVWIGANCTILPGVKIGSFSIIGAGSVVTKDIPANCIAVGNPAKVIKELKGDN